MKTPLEASSRPALRGVCVAASFATLLSTMWVANADSPSGAPFDDAVSANSAVFGFRSAVARQVGQAGCWDDAPPYTSFVCFEPEPEGAEHALVLTLTGRFGNVLTASSDQVFTYETVDITAKDGLDYTGSSGRLTIKAGASSTAAVFFPLLDDALDEHDEVFAIRTRSLVGAALEAEYAVMPIADNDPPAQMSIADAAGQESDGSLSFKVTLNVPSGKTIAVNYATADGTATAEADYRTTTGTLTLAPGDTEGAISIPIVDDGVAESDETFTVTLSNPVDVDVVDGTATGTIEDTGFKPTASVTTNPAGLEDTVGNLAFEVTIDSAGTETGTVDWTTADGTATADSDYTPKHGTLTFAAGETTMTIPVPVTPDTTVEPDETLTVTLSNGENLRIGNGTGTGTIGNDDFELSIVESREGPERGSLVFPVTVLGGGAGRTTVTVEYATADLTATEPADYGRELGTLTFPTGVAEQSITVDLVEDDLGETDEQFEVVLSNPMGAVMTAAKSTATILDDDQPEITVADARGPEDGGTLGFAVSLGAQSAAEVTVDYWTSEWTAKEGVDYQRAEDTLTFAAGQTSRTIEVTLVADGLQEDDEEFDLLLGRATYATVAEDADCFFLSSDACAVGTIENDDDPPRLSIADDEAAEAAGELAFVVTATNLDDPNVTATVLVATSGTTATADVDYEEKSETLTFTSTDPVRTFTVTVLDDRIDEPNETLAVTLTDQQNAELEDAAAVGTINDDDETSSAIALTAAPQYLNEGNGAKAVVVTATLDASARTGSTTVDVSVTASGAADAVDFEPVPDFAITIAAEETSGTGTFTLTPNDNDVDETDETVSVGGTSDLPVTGTTVALADDDEPSTGIELSANPSRVAEGGGAVQVEVTATLNGGAGTQARTVDVTVAPSGDAAAVGFEQVPDFAIAIGGGETSGTGTFTLTPHDNELDETDENLTLTGESDLPVTPASVVLADDDEPPTAILLSAVPDRIAEGGGSRRVEVTAEFDRGALAEATAVVVSVAETVGAGAVGFAVSETEFTITIAAEAPSGVGTFSVTPEDDVTDERDEVLAIAGAADLPVTGTSVTLVDDDEPSNGIVLSVEPAAVAEGAGATAVEVTAMLDAGARLAGTTVVVTVSGSGEPGAVEFEMVPDFEIVVAAGETSGKATFTLEPDDDQVAQSNETVALDGVADLPVAGTSLTIVDDDAASTGIVLSAVPARVSEGAGTLEVRVAAALNRAARRDATVVTVSVAGSGVAGSVDFAPVTDFAITIAAGAPSGEGSFTLTPEDDAVSEADEALTVSGTSDLPVTSTGVTLADDDEASAAVVLTAVPGRVSEGAGATRVTVTASLDRGLRGTPTTVTVAVEGRGNPAAVDFAPVPDFEIVIAAGTAAGTGTFVLDPEADAVVESDETLTVSGTSDLPVTPAVVTLSDDDEASTRIVLSAVPARVSEGAGPTPVAVTATLDRGLRQTATAVTVSVAGGGDPDTVDFDPVGDFRITIPANAASGSGTFVLRPEDDRNVESDDTLAVSGVSDLPVTSASVALADDDEVSTRILLFLTVNPAQASEGGGPVEVTVAAAVDKGVRPSPTRVAVTVTASGDPLAVDFAPVPDFEIVIPANAPEGTATFTVTPEDDMIVERDEVVTVAGTSDLPVTKAALSLLDDDEAGDILLAALPVRVTEGGGPVAVEVTASLAGSVRQDATTVTVSVSGSGDPTAVDFNPVADFAIVIAAGSASGSGTFMLTPEDDREDESDESLTISGASDLPVTPTSVSIIDDDESAPPALSVADASVAEGAAELAFVVDLDAPSSEEVTVRYGSADATAEAGSDYEPVSGTLAFAPGEVSKTVRVVVLDDELDEPDETLTLGLSHPRNATLARASASGTILDDDDPPVLSIAGASGMEGDGQLDFVISLSAPSIAEVTVRYATRDGTAAAGSDYRPVDGTMTFAPGQVAMTASVAVIDDTLDEVDEETFAVALSANTGASLDRAADRATATGVIVDDDDPPEVTVDDAAGDETVGSLAFVVSLGGPSAVDVAVDYATADDTATAGRDYEARSGTLSFAPGTVARTVLVPVLNDTEDEPDETFVVTLSDPRNATLAVSSATGTIIDDDESAPPALSVADASVAEGAAELAFVVDLDAPSSEEVTVRYGSADATAEAGSDYEPVSGTLAFAPGTVTRTILVPVLDDAEDEPDETFVVTLSDPRNATLAVSSATGTIIDDDESAPPALSVADASVAEGAAELAFVVDLDAPSSEEVTVRYGSADATAEAGSDYEPVSGTLAFAPGEVSKTVRVVVLDDELDEPDETLWLGLSHPRNATLARASASGTILDDDEPPVLSIAGASGMEGDGQLDFVISLSAPSIAEVTVRYATRDGTAAAGSDYRPVDGTMTFAPGQVAMTASVAVIDDTLDEVDEETFAVALSANTGASLDRAADRATATGVIVDDDDPPEVTVDDAAGDETVGSLAFVVSLGGPSAVDVAVDYATADDTATAGRDYEARSGTLSFAPGTVARTILVPVLDDAEDEPDETFVLALDDPRNATLADGSATGTIRDDDPSAPDLAGGFPNAALCVGGAPFELDLAGHFEGEQITFSVVSSAPGVATAVIAGTQLTVLPVAEGTAMVTVTASNPAGTSSGEVAVRVVADPAELAAVDAVLASIGRGVLSSVTASVGDRFAQRSALREEEPIRDAGAFMGAPEIPASPLADRTGRRGGIPTGHDPFGDLRNDRLRTPGRSAGFPRRGMAPFSFSLAGQAGGSGSAGLSWSTWGRGDQRRIEGGASGTSHDATLSGVHLGADVGGDDWLGGVSVLHSRAEADYRFDRSVDACGGGGTGEGILDAELTSIHPYGGRRIGRGWIWASVGVGGGEVSVERCKSGQVGDADVSMRLAAVGGRHPFAFGEQLAVSVVEEVGVVTVTTGSAAGPAGNRSVTAGLARIGLEAAGVTPLECKCSLSTYVRAFARGDWGDGATGAGLELAAGVRYRNLPRRLGIDAGIRALAVHSAEDAAERSANLTFSILPRADGTGLQASLAWQQQASDVRLDALGGISRWTAPAMDLPDAERHWIARSRLGYGIALRRGPADTRGIAMPFVEFDAAPSERGSARFGVRHEFGDRVRGLVVEWRIEQRSFPGAGNRIVLEVLGQF